MNSSRSETIFATLIYSQEYAAVIERRLTCSNCKNPIEKCGICGKVFKSRDSVFCSLLNIHYCKRCVNRIKKDNEKYRPRKRGAQK
jgi:hypothetical protein